MQSAVLTLLDRLDLSRPGLEKVRDATSAPQQVAAALLNYYRKRTSLRHPVARCSGVSPGEPLSAELRAVADDALRNILVACRHYPRHDFGSEIDWLTNRSPNGDREWIVQLNRHESWDALAQAYRATGDETYARCYVRQLLDWIGKCPCDSASDAWRTIDIGIRGHSWTGHFQTFLDAAAYTPETLVRHLNAFFDHAERLTSRPLSKNNWGLMEAEGAAFIAITFPEFRAAAVWRGKAFAHFNLKIHTLLRPDGFQVEQCLGYHLGCIDWFARSACLAEDNGFGDEIDPDYWRQIEAMCEIPMKVGFPDGACAQFGDDHGRFGWRARLLPYARRFKREDLLHAATGGQEGRAPLETAFALPHSGFYALRSGWDPDATMLLLKCGPDGGWHCQPDNGTFEIFAGRRRLLPDSGTYIYSGDEAGRKWFRQTRVHATMTLDGRDTAYAPKLLRWQPGPERDLLVVENEGYEGFTHRRTVLFVKKRFFLIVDEALGPATGLAMLHFQLPPGSPAPDADASTAHTGYADGTNLMIAAMPQPGLRLISEPGEVSFVYGRREPRPAFRFELTKTEQPLRFVTLLVPYTGTPPAVSVRWGDPAHPGQPAVGIDARVGVETTRIEYLP